jgi:hypothetical protein
MRTLSIWALVLAAIIGLAGPAAAEERAAPPDLSTVEGVVSALYRAVSFPPGSEPDWATLRTLLLPNAVIAQPVRGSDEVELLSVGAFIGRFNDDLDTYNMRETGFHETIARVEKTVFGRIAQCFVVFEPRTDPSSAEPLGRGVDSIELIRTGGRWWIAAITTEFERPGREIPDAFEATVDAAEGGAMARCSKLDFDLGQLDEKGLVGPPDGKVAVSYEFCIPKDQQLADEVRSIDPTIAIHADSRGRVGCGPMEVLCLGSTNQPNFREVLERLCELEYVQRIERTWFE